VEINSEREYKLLHLPKGAIRDLLTDEVREMVRTFDPLDFEPADKAKEWLQVNVQAEVLPLDTYLVFSEDETELLGFFVLELVEVRVATGDVPIMKLRGGELDPQAPVHPGIKLVWMVRSDSSSPGFGEELLEQALLLAVEAKVCALLVEPYDDDTAERLWKNHFQFRELRPGGDDDVLWHTLLKVDQLWG
jgi:hypothetical protein